jgi:endo-1,4-beta-xylanase
MSLSIRAIKFQIPIVIININKREMESKIWKSMGRFIHVNSLVVFLALMVSCQKTEKVPPSLKETFKDKFFIGTAINVSQIRGDKPEEAKLLFAEFNSITPEDDMQWMYIHPSIDTFNFEVIDQYVDLGETNNMFIIGHNLLWHSMLAKDVFKREQIGDLANDTLLIDSLTLMNRIEDHISNIVGRYKGRINGWDVVNEALNEDGSLRESNFLKIAGEGYIPRAFEFANEADPGAELYYNDYNLVEPAKRDGAIRIVKNLQEKGIRIDGVGVQAHWELDYPPLEIIEECILAYSDAGVKVMFTELDISVLPSPWRMPSADISVRFANNETMNPYPEGLPDSIGTALANRYREIFELFNKHSDKISRVTFWGLHDGVSWKNDFPIRGRTDYTMLFDRNLKPKEAYWTVVDMKSKEK